MVSARDNLEFNGRNWRTSILTCCRISGQVSCLLCWYIEFLKLIFVIIAKWVCVCIHVHAIKGVF